MKSYFFNRPKQPTITDTTELLRQVERKDALFRVTQTVFFVIVLATLVTVLVLSYQIQAENNSLIVNQAKIEKQTNEIAKQLQTSVSDLKASNKAQLTDLQNHIDCIVDLFAQPNHTSLVISGIQSCQLTSTASSSGGAAVSTKSSQPVVSTNKQQGSDSSNTNNGNSNPQPPTGNPQPHTAKRLVCTITLQLVCL